MTSDTTNYRNSFSLDGKVALVTGAAGTLGAEICRGLVSVGASVLITDIQEETGRAVRDELLATGAKAEFIKHNVVDEGEWEAAIKCAVDTFGGLDIVGVSPIFVGDFNCSCCYQSWLVSKTSALLLQCIP